MRVVYIGAGFSEKHSIIEQGLMTETKKRHIKRTPVK